MRLLNRLGAVRNVESIDRADFAPLYISHVWKIPSHDYQPKQQKMQKAPPLSSPICVFSPGIYRYAEGELVKERGEGDAPTHQQLGAEPASTHRTKGYKFYSPPFRDRAHELSRKPLAF